MQVILFSEGFVKGKEIGRKLVEVFKLSKELLSNQQHYDWGLRALKTVLRGSGQALYYAKAQVFSIFDLKKTDLCTKCYETCLI